MTWRLLSTCCYLLNGRHADLLIVVQRGVGGVQVVAKPSHSYFITVMKGHGYGNGAQGWDVLKNTWPTHSENL